jgi:hypothetical protein
MPDRTCSVDGCDNPIDARGWCHTHYERWRRTGTVENYRDLDLRGRVEARINRESNPPCWMWSGTSDGYGLIVPPGADRARNAHRVVYELYVGPIPDGFHLDHLCRTPHCVNPDHLEPVTPRENYLRGISPAAENARKTECVWGHPFDEENTYVAKNGSRKCKECIRRRTRERRARLRG